jgi:hypothetical protein
MAKYWKSISLYWRAVREAWIALFFTGLLGVVGAVALIWHLDVKLPIWTWFTAAVICLTAAQFIAFHGMRIERDLETAAKEKEAAKAASLQAKLTVTPRTLGQVDLSKHAEKMAAFKGTKVMLVNAQDGEAKNFADEINKRLLAPAGWQVVSRPGTYSASAVGDLGLVNARPGSVQLGVDGKDFPEAFWTLDEVLNSLHGQVYHSRNAAPFPGTILINVE